MTQQNLGQAVLELSTDQGPLDRGLEQARQKTQRVGASMGALGKKLSLGVTAPILGIGTAAFAAANSIDEAMATLATGTGATGAALEGLEASFTSVFSRVPVSAQDAAKALADLNTMLGLTGSALEEASIVALEAGKAMGIDTSTLIDRTTKAMQQFGVPAEEVTAIMNGMFVTSQNTGIGMDTLASNLQTFGPVLANMGLSLEESTALFGRLNTVGVDATRVFPGINAFMRKTAKGGQKELGDAIGKATDLLAKEEDALESNQKKRERLSQQIKIHETRIAGFTEKTSEAAKEAAFFKLTNMLEALQELDQTLLDNEQSISFTTERLAGLNQEFDEAANSTVDLRTEMGGVIDQIKNAATVTDALNIATDAFGAEGAQRLTVAIRDGAFALDDLTGAFAGTDGAIMANAEATRTAGEEMAIMKNQITEALAPAGVQLMGAFQQLVPVITSVVGGIASAIETFSNLPGPVQKIILGAIALAAALGPVLMIVGTLIPLLPILGAAIGILTTTAFGPLGLAIAAIIAIGFLLVKNWETISATIGAIWEGIIDTVRGAVNLLISLAEGYANIWLQAINLIIKGINAIRFDIPGFELPFGMGKFGGMSVGFNIPEVPLIQLPRLATGGIAMQETAAIVGDVPEAIIPLDRLGTMGSNHIHFHGPVYGQRDFERAVADAGKQLNRRGLG